MNLDNLWVSLGNRHLVKFGRECAGAAIIMFSSLVLRLLCTTLRVSSIVPYGALFACPYIIQVASYAVSFRTHRRVGQKICATLLQSQDFYPIVTVRITEVFLGNLSESLPMCVKIM